MKKSFLLFAIVFTNVLFAQKSIYIEYSVKIHEEKMLMESPPEFRSMFVEAMSSADDLSFGLIIYNAASKFYHKSNLSTSDDGISSMRSTFFTGYSGEVFQYLNNIYSESISLDKNMMIKKSLKNNWQLHNETKMIDNYLCYKATNVYVVENGSSKIFNHPVIAWYCPKLPYNYGPNGYSNLPGLILELQERNVVFGARKIDLDSDLHFDVGVLKSIKTISEEELNQKIREEYEELEKSLKN